MAVITTTEDIRRRFRTSAERPMAMLRSCPAYAPTPLISADAFVDELGIAKLWIKDESPRMGLGSFKALGGAFAVAQMIEDVSGAADLMSDAAKAVASDMTFITASAGNHGLSVAAGARVFGARAVIVLSSTVPEGFADRIRALEAAVVRIDGSYEDSIAYAISAAEENGWLHLADGTWEGYVERPALVMEGYTVAAEECRDAFEDMGAWPTHVFLQAGVGGFAAAIAANIRAHWLVQPNIVIVEPDAAPCLAVSVKAGELIRAEGPVSNMGRLDCKDASLIAFEALRHDANSYMTVTDEEASAAAEALRAFGLPTTASGAATFAALRSAELPDDCRCMIFVTEGPEGG